MTLESAFGQVVKVVSSPHLILYGCTVAEVILADGRSLNHELVRQGFAWWYRRYAPRDLALADLEAEARTAKGGIWSQSRPVPPWEWRGRAKEPLPANLEGKVIGNKRSHVDHQPGCKNAASMSPANRVPFDTAEAAQEGGAIVLSKSVGHRDRPRPQKRSSCRSR